MTDKIKNYIVTALFSLVIGVFALLCLLHKPVAVSESERRPLAQLPEFSINGIIKGNVISDFGKYTVDQFPLRDTFRSVKALVSRNIFLRTDNNGFRNEGNIIFKDEYPLNEDSVTHVSDVINKVYDKYFADGNHKIIYSVVPDKSYYSGAGTLRLDYDRLAQLLRDNINSNIGYADIFASLDLDDYYATDTHWTQDKLSEVVEKIGNALGIGNKFSSNYIVKRLHPFYGVYAGQSALPVPPDTIYYLTNSVIEGCTVYNYETGETGKVYDLDRFNGSDPYEIFLSGPTALLRIDNPSNTSGRRLIIFRDSFGSSLTPLLIEAYSSITVVDLRYVRSDFLGRLIEIEGNEDVLFLYSTIVLNSSAAIN